MKKFTPIRVHNLVEYGYNILRIEILQEKFKSDFNPTLEPIGVIQFSQKQNYEEWFGMQFMCSTSYNTNVIDNFNKIVKHINKYCTYDSQPINVIRAINGVQHQLINGELISVMDSGKHCFNVEYINTNNNIIERTGVYAKIIATDAREANMLLNRAKRTKKYDSYTLWIGDCFEIQAEDSNIK